MSDSNKEKNRENQSNQLRHIIPFFIPHLGCPHQCIFCNQHHVSGESASPKDSEIQQAINNWEGDTLPEIAFYGGSFSGLPYSSQSYFLTPAYHALKENKIRGIRISTRPDYINPEALDFLSSFGVKTVELGVQSLDPEVLARSCRGHKAEDVYRAVSLLKERGFAVGVQLMPGLPGDTREKSIQGALDIARMKPDMARIYPTLVLKDTPLHKLFLEERYHPLSLNEAVTISRDMLAIFRFYGVQVIRTGLQPTNDIAEGAKVVAGPFHPAFGELVKAALAKEQAVMAIEEFLPERTNEMPKQEEAAIALWVSPRDCSIMAGHKRNNIEYLKNHFHLTEIKIIGTNNLDRGTIGISKKPEQPQLIIPENRFLLQYVTKRLMAN
ncbi:MAG: elongator complex protein 3 [Bacillota bacterium]|jgi:histone acetyltransferase (RNA polymerase elongator complex component)